ncbi:hypothetical protein V2K16_22870 [Pseudomonas alliivorans]|uniref:hypothetical protein n=1 Tax=Pseudomonas alliivorans TaxID=2810613 RepID=UPI001AE79E93|nr:hypothetical protein [Pseudomonas alliivorans]MBP0943124.1 hypothetical protein [Pseudomonas alliivorans]MEE4881220.1 hypothetical protein [Pseudomonas alliivorans]MEE4932524.1 hypothetical protein [Pseudomonas alliivorans]MEE4937987.1 hypothetical protein [Pseudomonas alliivorans]MEE4943081.1 hypothetical protein [Pseudomonas alliivorans]
MNDERFTVGDLQRQLRMLSPDDELQFDGGLTFSQIKRRGDDLQVLEFCEPQAYLDESFREDNPHIQVAFVRTEPLEAGQFIQEVDVGIR